MNEEKITFFAQTDARNKRVKFGIKNKDRTKHVYVIGKTGMGKSTLLENMAVQDIQNGEGMAFIDPHGKSADLLLEYVPPSRVKDVVYFAPFDTEYPISFNVLESVDPDKRHLVVSGLMSIFKKIWLDAWSARMEYILTNTLLALLEYPEATLLGVNRMLSDREFRRRVISFVTDPSVKLFWTEEFANYTERMAAEAVPAIQNKIGQFTANALIRNMIGQPKSSFNIRELMDNKKIMVINLSKGRIGETNANLLGGMLITKIYLAAISRADVSDKVIQGLPSFYLYVDEFQSFANESFANILSEARKYKLNLTIAHQYIEQMEEEVRAAVFGNVGTMVVFRVGAYDAEVLEKEFAPQFTAEDLVNLGIYQIYLKLMIDGVSSHPFSASTLGPIPLPEKSSMQEAIEMSRKQFTRSRAEIEAKIVEWHEPIKPPPKPQPAGQPSFQQPKPQFQPQSQPQPREQVPAQAQIPAKPRVIPAQVQPKITPPIQPPPVQPKIIPQAVVPPKNIVPQAQTPRPSNPPQTQAPPSQPAPAAIPPKPVSLSSLNRSNPPFGAKEASQDRVNELRNALASVLGGVIPPPKAEPKPEVKKEVNKVHENKAPVNLPSKEPAEVSTETLKNVLKTD